MIVRAFKHILQAVVAAVEDINDMAGSIASCLNILLGSSPAENVDCNSEDDTNLKQKWLEIFLEKRFGWRWKDEYSLDLRKYAILRGLCHKVLYLNHTNRSNQLLGFYVLSLQKSCIDINVQLYYQILLESAVSYEKLFL